jgi:lipoprotein-anchoring transpeptidase ErfK/SrfK
MTLRARLLPVMIGCVLAWSAFPAQAAKPGLAPDKVNGARFAPLPAVPSKRPSAAVLRAEVLLDRARFSPGAIDGLDGDNFRKAVRAYQGAVGLPATGRLDQATWDRLTADQTPVLVRRALTEADLKGPFIDRIPSSLEDEAGLQHLGYTSVQEGLSEQVHASISLLRALNPGVNWRRAGTDVVVPQVVAARPAAKVARIVVDKAGHAVNAYAADGKLAAFYPASIGSQEKPAPTGQFVIRRIIHNPDYTYNPKYAFKGVKADKPFTVAPGPNNPVGSVWLDLSYQGYGIHGTPEPDLVGKTQSHGCVRLTNWDVEDLASMVRDGTPVTFQDGPQLDLPAPAAGGGKPTAPPPAASK